MDSDLLTKKIEQKKQRKKTNFNFVNICCCFNSDLCCGWYKPRACLLILIVLFNIIQSLAWLILVILYLSIVPNYYKSNESKDLIFQIFQLFNPFLKQIDCDPRKEENCDVKKIEKSNSTIMANMMILSIPQMIVMIYVTYKGLVAWGKNFELKATERFYRYIFTSYLYNAMIKLLIFIQIGPDNQGISIWV